MQPRSSIHAASRGCFHLELPVPAPSPQLCASVVSVYYVRSRDALRDSKEAPTTTTGKRRDITMLRGHLHSSPRTVGTSIGHKGEREGERGESNKEAPMPTYRVVRIQGALKNCIDAIYYTDMLI